MDLQSIVSFFSSIYDFLFKVVGCEPALIIAVLFAVTIFSKIGHVKDNFKKDKNLILGSMSFVFSFLFLMVIGLGKEPTPLGDTFSQTLRLGAVTSFSYMLLKSYSKLIIRVILKMIADKAGVTLTSSEMKTLEESSEPTLDTLTPGDEDGGTKSS